jgi:hypothetical protein
MQIRYPASAVAGPQVSLVFPAFNPGPGIDEVWQQVQAFRQETRGDWEFLFVCDGCTDGTPERLHALTEGVGDRVRVLTSNPNRGKGHAVRLGLEAARGRWRLFTDIDLAYGFADIAELARTLQAGADVAIGSRSHPDSRLLLPPHLLGHMYRRRLQSLAFATLARLLLPLKWGDTQAGLKGLSRRAAELVLPRLRCCGFEFDCELLTACARLGLEVVEVPVTVRCEDSASTTRTARLIKSVRELLDIRRRWRDVAALAPLESDAVSRRAA